MPEREAPSPAAPAAITSAALTWWKYDVVHQQSLCRHLSIAARGLDALLTDDAWANPDGSCSVPMRRLLHLCVKESLDAPALWQELQDSGRWERSKDKKTLTAIWLRELRQGAAGVIEKRRYAGKKSGESRRAAPKRAEHMLNTCSDSDAPSRTRKKPASRKSLHSTTSNTCSTHTQQKREESRTTDLSSRDHVVQLSAGDGAPASSATAASHAGGAAAALADPPTAAAARVTPDLKSLLAEENIRAVEPPLAWMDADLPVLVEVLQAADTGVDIERALYRACAAHQKRGGAEAHVPMVSELRLCLAGAEGRAGLVGSGEAAARAMALALHGTAVTDVPPAPLVLRAVAGAIDRELRTHGAEGDPKRMAVRVALDFVRGVRKASGYTVAGEAGVSPRLAGHRVSAAVPS